MSSKQYFSYIQDENKFNNRYHIERNGALWVPLVEQELLTLPEHPEFTPDL
jgi:hypothetical protein